MSLYNVYNEVDEVASTQLWCFHHLSHQSSFITQNYIYIYIYSQLIKMSFNWDLFALFSDCIIDFVCSKQYLINSIPLSPSASQEGTQGHDATISCCLIIIRNNKNIIQSSQLFTYLVVQFEFQTLFLNVAILGERGTKECLIGARKMRQVALFSAHWGPSFGIMLSIIPPNWGQEFE